MGGKKEKEWKWKSSGDEVDDPLKTFPNRGLLIRGQERLLVWDLTLSFSAYSQKIDFPEIFIALFFLSQKLAQSTFLKKVKRFTGRKTIKPSNWIDNLSVRHYDILAKTRSKKTTTITFSAAKMTLVHARALLTIEKISYIRSRSRPRLSI